MKVRFLATLLLLMAVNGGEDVARRVDASPMIRGRAPNELGRIPILVYHNLGATEGRWQRSHDNFRADLEQLYARGYRPITVTELVHQRIDLPAGLSPVVFTFDDASPSQFSYVEREHEVVIDPESAVGMWLAFARAHPDWRNRAVFCVLTAADAGHALFGDRGIAGQRTEWRHPKVQDLVRMGFEVCGHTMMHSNLGKLNEAAIQEQIARGLLAIDSAVPGHRVRTFALPYGAWPSNRDVVRSGTWRDPRTGRTMAYRFDAIMEGWGGTAASPFSPTFDPLRLRRVQVTGTALTQTLDWLDEGDRRYVSDGDPTTVAGLQGAEGLSARAVRRSRSQPSSG